MYRRQQRHADQRDRTLGPTGKPTSVKPAAGSPSYRAWRPWPSRRPRAAPIWTRPSPTSPRPMPACRLQHDLSATAHRLEELRREHEEDQKAHYDLMDRSGQLQNEASA